MDDRSQTIDARKFWLKSAWSSSKTDGTQALAIGPSDAPRHPKECTPGSVFHVNVLCRPDHDPFYGVDVSASEFVSISMPARLPARPTDPVVTGWMVEATLWRQQRTGPIPFLGQGWRRPMIASAMMDMEVRVTLPPYRCSRSVHSSSLDPFAVVLPRTP